MAWLRRCWLPLAAPPLLALGLWFRLAVVASYQAPAGDGLNYYALSQELIRAGRYAYGPPPAPLSHSRMPGYPLFLAHVAVREAPLSLQAHLIRATRWNAMLDLGTALLVLLILHERGLGPGAALGAAALVIAYPLLWLLSAYGLTESLATFLGTLALWLCLRALSRRPLLHGALAGAAVGLGVLVRLDMVAAVPPCLLALWLGAGGRGRRALSLAAFLAAGLAVFAPWPLRNLARFGAPYPQGTELVAQNDGRALPTGIVRWAQTWASGAPGDSYIFVFVARQLPIPARVLIPKMYDSVEEKQRLLGIIERYNRHGLDAVDGAWRELAEERRRRAPLRTYVVLPALRFLALFRAVPESDLPMRSSFLRLPARRRWFAVCDMALYLTAALGALLLLRAGGHRRATAIILLSAILVRASLFPWVHPCPVQRYLIEVFPALMALSASAVGMILGRAAYALGVPRAAGGRAPPPPSAPRSVSARMVSP